MRNGYSIAGGLVQKKKTTKGDLIEAYMVMHGMNEAGREASPSPTTPDGH